MDDCVFCSIVTGSIPAYKVFEDEDVLAFLSIEPVRPGHTLVIPKRHEPDFFKLEDKLYQKVMEAVRSVAIRADEAFKPKKVGLIVAGWDVPHTHVHVIPMHEYHDITSESALKGTLRRATDEELATALEKLSNK